MDNKEINELKRFFLVTPLGLEQLAAQELVFWHKEAKDLEELKGGVEFTSTFAKACELNTCLKVPSRILLRLTDFRCRDFPKLFQKIQKIKWGGLLNSKHMDIVTSVHKSRINNRKRVQLTVFEALQKSKDASLKLEDIKPQKLFIRFFNDQCFVSVDLSGDHLHQRGYKTFSTDAPIRENLAAAMVYEMFGSKNWTQAAEDIGKIKLIDPMCGSGTLLLEAAQLFTKNKLRPYGCDKMLTAEQLEKPGVFEESTYQWAGLEGYDISDKSIEASHQNLANTQNVSLRKLIKFQEQDIFKADEIENNDMVSASKLKV